MINSVKEAVEYLKNLSLEDLSVGRYQVSEGFYYVIQEYTTKPEKDCMLETHNNYIDIQWIIYGEERIDFTEKFGLINSIPYDENKDIEFWYDREYLTQVVLKSGSYIILYPNNAHKPCIAVDNCKTIKKLVAKVKV